MPRAALRGSTRSRSKVEHTREHTKAIEKLKKPGVDAATNRQVSIARKNEMLLQLAHATNGGGGPGGQGARGKGLAKANAVNCILFNSALCFALLFASFVAAPLTLFLSGLLPSLCFSAFLLSAYCLLLTALCCRFVACSPITLTQIAVVAATDLQQQLLLRKSTTCNSLEPTTTPQKKAKGCSGSRPDFFYFLI